MAKTKAKKSAPKKSAPKKTAAKKSAPKKSAPKKSAKKAPAKKARVAPLPKGYTSVTPVMNQTDSRATMEFCKEAFGAKLRSVMEGPNGKVMHAEMVIGDGVIMLSDAVFEPARVSSVFLYVKDVDKTMAQAADAGAKVIMPAADQFWGDRFGRLVDPFGNFWGVATHIEDVTPAEMRKRMAAMATQMAERAGDED